LIEQWGQVTSDTNWFNFNVIYNSQCMIDATRMTGTSNRGYITTEVNSNLSQFRVVGWTYGDSTSKNSALSSYYSKGY